MLGANAMVVILSAASLSSCSRSDDSMTTSRFVMGSALCEAHGGAKSVRVTTWDEATDFRAECVDGAGIYQRVSRLVP
jgi:hypothetical protein